MVVHTHRPITRLSSPFKCQVHRLILTLAIALCCCLTDCGSFGGCRESFWPSAPAKISAISTDASTWTSEWEEVVVKSCFTHFFFHNFNFFLLMCRVIWLLYSSSAEQFGWAENREWECKFEKQKNYMIINCIIGNSVQCQPAVRHSVPNPPFTVYARAQRDLLITLGLMPAIKKERVCWVEGVCYIWPLQHYCISACCHLSWCHSRSFG